MMYALHGCMVIAILCGQRIHAQPWPIGMGGADFAGIIKKGMIVSRGAGWESDAEDDDSGMPGLGVTTSELGGPGAGMISVTWNGGGSGAYNMGDPYELQLAQTIHTTGDFCWYFDALTSGGTISPGVTMDATIAGGASLSSTISSGTSLELLAASSQYADLGSHRSSCLGNLKLCTPCQLITFWFYPMSGDGQHQMVLDGGGHFSSSHGPTIQRSKKCTYDLMYKSTDGADNAIQQWNMEWPMRENEWHHISVNYYYTTDTTGLYPSKVYINGEVIGSAYATAITQSPDNPIYDKVFIGTRHTTQDSWFGNFKIDDLCVEFSSDASSCKTDEEVKAIYEAAAKGNKCGYVKVPGQGMNCMTHASATTYIECQNRCNGNSNCNGFIYSGGVCKIDDTSLTQNSNCQAEDKYIWKCACQEDEITPTADYDCTAYYPFDEMVCDEIIVAHGVIDMVVNSGSPTLVSDSVRGKALSLDNSGAPGGTPGVTQSVLLGNHKHRCMGDLEMCTAGITISFWIKHESAAGTFNEAILEGGGWWSTSYGYSCWRHKNPGGSNAGGIACVARESGHNGSGFKCKGEFGVLSPNAWHHLVLVFDKGPATPTVATYVDGVADSQPDAGCSPRSPATSAVDEAIMIGGNQAQSSAFASYLLDELCFYEDRVMSAGEVSALYSEYMAS